MLSLKGSEAKRVLRTAASTDAETQSKIQVPGGGKKEKYTPLRQDYGMPVGSKVREKLMKLKLGSGFPSPAVMKAGLYKVP